MLHADGWKQFRLQAKKVPSWLTWNPCPGSTATRGTVRATRPGIRHGENKGTSRDGGSTHPMLAYLSTPVLDETES